MKKLGLFILLTWLLASCNSIQQDAKTVQHTLDQQQALALTLTEKLGEALQGNSFDSVRLLTQQHPDILFYVFNAQEMVYWSDNWLSASHVTLRQYDRWYYQRFDNAHAVCRWTRSGDLNVLTIIPIRYNYPFENQQLHNTFIPPFNSQIKVDVTTVKNVDHPEIQSLEGDYLFSLCAHDSGSKKPVEESSLAQSFSYRNLLTPNEEQSTTSSKINFRTFLILAIVLLVLLIVVGIVGIWRSRGWKGMTLAMRIQYLMVATLVVSFVCFFLVSVNYTRSHYEARQRKTLQQKTQYIQKSLQDMYFWNIGLTPRNAAGLNVDLRDLSFAFETDIHVYDMSGNLIGSSSPLLFEKGLISMHMEPEVFFSGESTQIRTEEIGDMHYLAGYTEFLNGNYVQIGYIEVPLFISQDEVNQEVDNFLQRLLPFFLIVLLLAILITVLLTRSMTRPLNTLSDSLQHIQIGRHNAHLDYEGKDEVGVLVMRYNELVDQLEESAEQLASSEREGAWRTMARQISHEIKNPLTPMKLMIQQMQRCKGTEKFDAYFDKATAALIDHIDNLSHIASSFSTFAKTPVINPSKVDVAQKLSSVITVFRNNQEHVPIRYVGADSGVMAIADAEQISQVFTNLIKNALQAIEHDGKGDIIVGLRDMSDRVEVSVSDNGCGIPEDIRDKVFRPNFTTKSTGTGLGLAISKNIVEGADGQISFETSEKGTTFFVKLRKN